MKFIPKTKLPIKVHAATKNQKLIIFDLDGTLIDTAPDLAHCMDLVMRELNLPKQGLQKVRKYIGNGVYRLVEDTLSVVLEKKPEQVFIDQAYNSFVKHYEKNLVKKSYLYPNILNSLKELKSKNINLACITNKLEAFTLPLLKHFQIYEYFDLVISGDSLDKKKPDAFPLEYASSRLGVAVANCMMVGDSENDVLAAKNAGMTSVCVSYGYTDKEAICELKPDIVLDLFSQLLDYI